jgi:hypothetical protein
MTRSSLSSSIFSKGSETPRKMGENGWSTGNEEKNIQERGTPSRARGDLLRPIL